MIEAGRNRTAFSRLSASSLRPLALLYRGAMAARNYYYDSFASATRAAGLPVISIGNITAGGTGKTPLVIEVVRRLCRAGRRPAILTRGYRGGPGRPADEVQEFELALPHTRVVVNANRLAGALEARARWEADCLVLDDGFQHRRLRRDLDVVLIDALDPWGGGRLLPAGRLREPLESLARADWVVVTRSNQADTDAVQAITRTLDEYAPHVPVTKAAVFADELTDSAGGAHPLEELQPRRVLPVAGVGNPATFVRLLHPLAGSLADALVFRDHHAYSLADVERIIRVARAAGVNWVVTTRKDWVKLRQLWPPPGDEETFVPGLYRLDMRMALADPRGEFDVRLARLFEEHG